MIDRGVLKGGFLGFWKHQKIWLAIETIIDHHPVIYNL